ncbi:hypothetical protein [Streptomyces violarus]|uniref:hypothetical protein n=1 Tax=Streptomyces violarus TaxID=67380 RepID=UPI0021C0B86C|nr:hypothetical protein [Streptomyces violarus]MCT9141883.1 hypothetical protein [Streptomyces violarus]
MTTMTAAYDFEPHEHALIVAAASTLDEVEAMEAALAASGPVVKGSTGQDRVNPLIPALANHRLTLLRILKQLGIEDENSAPLTADQRAASAKASHAARMRWGVQRGA